VVQVREPVDFWIEPSEEDLARNPDAQAELMTVYVRRTPTQEIPYLDRYEAMLIRLRHIMTDIKVDGSKAQNRLDKLAGEYNQLMEEMIMFSVDMPEGGYFRLDAAALNYLQSVIRELSRAQQADDDDDDGQGNW
jgi:hypothetical protein